jgi:hypothetical protein
MEESPRAIDAFNEYYQMGPDRSLPNLHELYKNRAENAPKNRKIKVPALTTLKLWSTTFNWQKRIFDLEKSSVDEEIAAKRAKKLENAEKVDEEQAAVSRGLWIEAAKLLSERIKSKDISNNALVLLVKESWAVHRLSVGSSTARIENELSTNPEKPLVISAEFGIASKDQDDS